MKKSGLAACDTGPLVAILDKNDEMHKVCASVIRNIQPPMLTVWPVLTEAAYILSHRNASMEPLLHMVENRFLRLARLGPNEAARMRLLIRKYSDLPMDLADAALVAACERENVSKIFTIDYRDFSLYRPRHTSHFEFVR